LHGSATFAWLFDNEVTGIEVLTNQTIEDCRASRIGKESPFFDDRLWGKYEAKKPGS
jgi:hypothetical protein